MKKRCFILLGLLIVWFTFDMFGLAFGSFVLVEAAWNSIDGIWWLIFISLSFVFYFKPKVGKYLLIVFLLMWVYIQFMSHWYYTIFGVTEEKLISYNDYFNSTFHLIPSSGSVLIPDLYHITLHFLIVLNLFCIVRYSIKNKGN